jgi:glutamate-5-semialdehyde dehydrogenase
MNATIHSSDWKEAVVNASRTLQLINDKTISGILLALADEITISSPNILKANAEDLAAMDKSNPMYDRLLLNEQRLDNIAADIRNVAGLASPLGKTLLETVRPNGMKISKVTVPFGVIGIVYEARPNVTFDVFSLCLKSGNVCVLKGGSDAYRSNVAIVGVIRDILKRFELSPDIITLLPAGHEATADLLNAVGYVDLIIPRGGKGLIDFVRTHSKIPVIETGAGICHTYFDEFGDTKKGSKIIFNAKTDV